MIKLLALLFLVYILSTAYSASTTQARIGSYETSNFKISGGASLNTFNDMKANGVPDETLMKFATMEDKFLEYEKQSVCYKYPTIQLAISMSQQIQELFPGYNFSYHTMHLKQISERDKMVNKNLVCDF
jgi:hypothetical protein